MSAIRLISLMTLMVLCLVSCTSDEASDQVPAPDGHTLQVLPVSASFVDVRAMRRASYLPTGYIDYNSLDGKTHEEYANIGMFVEPLRSNPSADYIYQTTDDDDNLVWKSTISVKEDQTYYMYGFMPRTGAENAVIAPLSEDYANGATITLNGFNTLTPADVCVVVGLRKATAAEESAGTLQEALNLGSFDYTAGAEGHNSCFVLLKHIYSGLRFKIHIDPTYHQMRTIKVTKVQLEAEDIAETVDLSMTVTANDTGADPLTSVTYTPSGTSANCTITLFPWEGSSSEFEVPEAIPETFLACFAPASCTSFVLKSTYDVYDRKGNLIRKGCQTSNQLNSDLLSGLSAVTAGDIFNIDLCLKPSYLYVLSDLDLNNPTFDLTTE